MARGWIGGVTRLGLAGGLAAAALTLCTQPAAADWLGNEHRATADLSMQAWPALSGDKLVYTDDRNERTVGTADDPVTLGDIRVLDLSTGVDRNLTPEHTASGKPAISGNRVVWHDHGDGAGTGGLWYHNLATGAHKRLPVTGGVDPEIDGTRACYERDNRIYVYSFSTGKEGAVSPANGSASSCDISGMVVVWQDHRNGSGADIYAYDLAASAETRLTTDPADQLAPRVDGNRVVWHDQRNGTANTDIYSYDLVAGAETRVTEADGVQWFADVSGDRVVWMDQRDGDRNTEVYLYDLASGVETRVTNEPGWSGNPAISGNRIVYQDNDAGNDDLYWRRITPPVVTADAPRLIGSGRSVDVSGSVTGQDGTPVAAETVQLEYSLDGRTWLPRAVTTTSMQGTYTVSMPSLTHPTRLRVRFAGTPEFPAAISPELAIDVMVLHLRGVELR